jgi:S-adenosylmethionine-diacylglycerol 3-amino-3-carboxypropyl transferase
MSSASIHAIEHRADFSKIRYAQCWEDADVLLGALDVQPGDHCLSIASAGDNALALLARDPARVYAIDLSPAQIACVALRVEAYRRLDHPELLELVGSRGSERRWALYQACREGLSADVRAFWDERRALVEQGIGAAGKFEDYFKLFRTRVLPLVHSHKRVLALLEPRDAEARRRFYDGHWDTWRWRLLFRVFFSRFVMGRLGRDPEFFRYVDGSVGNRILARTRYALRELDPASNPYVRWILTGAHGDVLPFALREENFAAIRRNLDRLEWRVQSLGDFLDDPTVPMLDRFNLSDIFEYMTPAETAALLQRIAQKANPGGRLVYWNMLAPRRTSRELNHLLLSRDDLAEAGFARDKAFFYSALVVEERR